MDSQSTCSGITMDWPECKLRFPHLVNHQTDCQKRSAFLSRLQQIDMLITGYNRLLSLPECPANANLMEMTKKEKIQGLEKKELLVSESLLLFLPALTLTALATPRLKVKIM
ncbi:hypothetical protein TNCT_54771 [Trichonephila clavata]|uniref:Uncharacterized protein n=1 Tax=Trichonephila clavata TaxID=2740835 RepID=A0A8X6KES7_TRICU|nr:hypothetical protein TNCT_54771 [Trichonephila clavata]